MVKSDRSAKLPFSATTIGLIALVKSWIAIDWKSKLETWKYQNWKYRLNKCAFLLKYTEPLKRNTNLGSSIRRNAHLKSCNQLVGLIWIGHVFDLPSGEVSGEFVIFVNIGSYTNYFIRFVEWSIEALKN